MSFFRGRTRVACGAQAFRTVRTSRRAQASIASFFVLALSGVLVTGIAWADNNDVTTDDTGVVDTSSGNNATDASSADGSSTNADGASADASGSSDANDAATTDSAETQIDENNLVNPQQKPDSSFIYDTSIADLEDADSYLNDQTVQVTGEVVGDRLKVEFDPGYYWIVLQANDKSYAEVPVYIAGESTEAIDTYGSYGKKGTTLQVRGTFHLTCAEHEGLTDLHADTVTVVEKGSITEQVFDLSNFIPGIVLVVVGCVLVLIFRRMREGQR